ncbi:hypothetical protein [Paenibacillus lentus]|uniref:Uncharacterized protein n=1 Tax=Paenibacillus lentus TaxID=1338368 RepID=A0A3Q8S4V7_9BACL|nr:hypothetical protein [Paenibacillus lentus]AZK46671.1 hypothetical protein EIM92_11315 [Paenibacillus lentus]
MIKAINHMDTLGRDSIKELITGELADYICVIIEHSNEFDGICNKSIYLQAKDNRSHLPHSSQVEM